MTEWMGGGEHSFTCDQCQVRSELIKEDARFIGIPDGWTWLAICDGAFPDGAEVSGETYHFCSWAHVSDWLRAHDGRLER